MLKFGNKEFNNLQEQVLENANDILEIKQGLGTALPNPIAGPAGPIGPQGVQGVQGIRGSAWTVGTDLPASANLGDIHLLWNGDVYQYTTSGWVLRTNIRGSQGVEGKRGFTGPQGDRGPQGPQGPQGLAGPIYKIVGQLDSIEELPDPATIATNDAYIVGNDIYGIINDEWVNLGPKLVISDAASIVSTSAGLLTASNVQDAITQLSDADNISLGLDNLGDSVYDGISNLNSQITEVRGTAATALQGNPKVLELNGDNLTLSSFTNIGISTAGLAGYDILKITLTAEKEIATGIYLHKGVYFFRKTGYRTLDDNSTIDHVVFELAYNASTHNFSGRDVSVYIESYRDNGIILGTKVTPDNNDLVHRSGNESITGRKTFSDFKIQSNDYDNIASIYTTSDSIVIKSDDEYSHQITFKPATGDLITNTIYAPIIFPTTSGSGIIGSNANVWRNVYTTYLNSGNNQIAVEDIATETYVDEAIASAGGGGGSSYTTITEDANKNIFISPNDIESNLFNIQGTTGLIKVDNASSNTRSNGITSSSTAKNATMIATTTDYTTNQYLTKVTGAGGIAIATADRIASLGLGSDNKAMAWANGVGSLAFTANNSFNGNLSYASGATTTANDIGSVAIGPGVFAYGPFNVAIGKYSTKTDDKPFIIGNGANAGTAGRSNAFTVDWSGNVVAAGTISPTGADYAEYFEFADGNSDNEDRMGYLVELVGDKIQLANGTDILGATSGTKGVIGDAEEMNWHGKYEKDEFGRIVYETETRVLDDGTVVERTEKKISADYDPEKPYTPRSKRPEWYPVGLLGKLLVRQDGSLHSGDYVAAINGIATKSEERTNIKVLEVISEDIVKVLVR